MTTHDLAPFVTTFFTRHLPAERNASPHTIAAYRDTLKLLLRFLAASLHRTASALHVEDLTPERTLAFLEDLETTRRNTIRTRNARLAAIHSFFRYVLDTEPALALLCQRVLAIPVKKAPRPVLGYLSDTELAHVLAQIDRSTPVQERQQPAKGVAVGVDGLWADGLLLQEMVSEERTEQWAERGTGSHGAPFPSTNASNRAAAGSSTGGVAVRYQ